jgi:EAL domain-containing protein (putative c-di-GMP-specific phosphodiesterase class I)/GGDEF domain-containing protein
MTLGRLLAGTVSALFLVALVGVEAIHLRSAQAHLQRQLESTAQDAATSLGLALGVLMRGGDVALAETIINPAFDRGHYERIEFLSARGERLVSRVLPAERGRYPAWFVDLFPLQPPTAESLVSAGWRQVGKVRVTAHPRFAYEQLWNTARDTVLYLLFIYVSALLLLRAILRGILQPLAAIEDAAQQISERNFVTLRLKPATRELARVVQAMNAMSRRVNEVIEAGSQRAERLLASAHRDPVTGLLNGRGFAARFKDIYEAGHVAFSGVFAVVEIADLSAINREIGPDRCDDMLRQLYHPMDDTAVEAGGFAGRWTGALTAMALPKLSGAEGRERLAALRAQAARVLEEWGVERAGRIYCGAVVAAGRPLSFRQLVRAAEEALLQARESPDGLVIAGSPMPDEEQEGDIASTVRDALAARRIHLVAQTVYRMSDHRAMHVEIMARLRDAGGAEIMAAQFVPVVAAHGLGEALDMAVIERVARLARGRDELISINVSMRSAERLEFVDWLTRLLQSDRAAAARLVFELPEHGVVQNEAAADAFARMVKASGAGFAIDHFGMHRDSFSLVPRLRPAYLKFSGAHTPEMMKDPGVRFLAESLAHAARQLDIPVIAQNVEHDAMYQAIAGVGFAGYQGNLGGRPSPWPPS